MAEHIELITADEARKILGVRNKSHMYKMIKAGTFPQPVRTGVRAVRFVRSECEGFALALVLKRDEMLAKLNAERRKAGMPYGMPTSVKPER